MQQPPKPPKPPEPPRRRLPPWRRLLLEYAAIALTYVAVLFITGTPLWGIVVMVIVMLVLRWTRPPYHQKPGDRQDDKDKKK